MDLANVCKHLPANHVHDLVFTRQAGAVANDTKDEDTSITRYCAYTIRNLSYKETQLQNQ